MIYPIKVTRTLNSYKAILSNGFILYTESLIQIMEVCTE